MLEDLKNRVGRLDPGAAWKDHVASEVEQHREGHKGDNPELDKLMQTDPKLFQKAVATAAGLHKELAALFSTSDNKVNELLRGLTGREIHAVRLVYQDSYKTDLEHAIEHAKISGKNAAAAYASLSVEYARPEDMVQARATSFTKNLLKTQRDVLGPDKDEINSILRQIHEVEDPRERDAILAEVKQQFRAAVQAGPYPATLKGAADPLAEYVRQSMAASDQERGVLMTARFGESGLIKSAAGWYDRNIADHSQRDEALALLGGDGKQAGVETAAAKLKSQLHGGLLHGATGHEAEAVISTLEGCRSVAERQEVLASYEKLTGKSLLAELKGTERDAVAALTGAEGDGALARAKVRAARMKMSSEHLFADREALMKQIDGREVGDDGKPLTPEQRKAELDLAIAVYDATYGKETQKVRRLGDFGVTELKGFDQLVDVMVGQNDVERLTKEGRADPGEELEHAKIRELREHGEAKETTRLQLALKGSLLANKDELLAITRDKSPAEIEALCAEYKRETGGDLRAEIRQATHMESWLGGGRKGHDIDEQMKGSKDDAGASNEQKARRLVEHEQSDYVFERSGNTELTDTFSRQGLETDAQHQEFLKFAAAAIADHKIDDAELLWLQRHSKYSGQNVQDLRATKDGVASALGTAAAAVAAAALMATGVGGPVGGAILAALASGAAEIATKAAVLGNAYGTEEAGTDALKTLVSAASGAAMAKIGPALDKLLKIRPGAAAPLYKKVAKAAAEQGMNGVMAGTGNTLANLSAWEGKGVDQMVLEAGHHGGHEALSNMATGALVGPMVGKVMNGGAFEKSHKYIHAATNSAVTEMGTSALAIELSGGEVDAVDLAHVGIGASIKGVAMLKGEEAAHAKHARHAPSADDVARFHAERAARASEHRTGDLQHVSLAEVQARVAAAEAAERAPSADDVARFHAERAARASEHRTGDLQHVSLAEVQARVAAAEAAERAPSPDDVAQHHAGLARRASEHRTGDLQHVSLADVQARVAAAEHGSQRREDPRGAAPAGPARHSRWYIPPPSAKRAHVGQPEIAEHLQKLATKVATPGSASHEDGHGSEPAGPTHENDPRTKQRAEIMDEIRPEAERARYHAARASVSELGRTYLERAIAAGHPIETLEAMAASMRGRSDHELHARFAGDGAIQVYDASCAPTTAQAALAFVDPVRSARGADDPLAVVREQRDVLEKGGGIARPRGYTPDLSQDRHYVNDGDADPEFLSYLRDADPAVRKHLLESGAYSGDPTWPKQGETPMGGKGMSFDALKQSKLVGNLQERSGLVYERWADDPTATPSPSRGFEATPHAEIQASLRAGGPVFMDHDGHSWLIVPGGDPAKVGYLVYDVTTRKTVRVPMNELGGYGFLIGRERTTPELLEESERELKASAGWREIYMPHTVERPPATEASPAARTDEPDDLVARGRRLREETAALLARTKAANDEQRRWNDEHGLGAKPAAEPEPAPTPADPVAPVHAVASDETPAKAPPVETPAPAPAGHLARREAELERAIRDLDDLPDAGPEEAARREARIAKLAAELREIERARTPAGPGSAPEDTTRAPAALAPQQEKRLAGLSSEAVRVGSDANGILGEHQVGVARAAMEALPGEARVRFLAVLEKAQSPVERVYLLKALAAGQPMERVEAFAARIRGQDPGSLTDRLTLTDPNMVGRGLKQQYNNTCATAMAQALRAEYDPTYADELREHNPDLHERAGRDGNPDSLNAHASREQVLMFAQAQKAATGKIDPSQQGLFTEEVGHLLNSLTSVTKLKYAPVTPTSQADALQQIVDNVRRGAVTPLLLGKGGQGAGHYVLARELRRVVVNGRVEEQIQFADTGKGVTRWISISELLQSATDRGRSDQLDDIALVWSGHAPK